MKPILKYLLIGNLIWYFGEGLLGPLYAIFAESIGGDIFAITWAWAVYLICGGLLSIVVGNFADKKRDSDVLMVIGYAINAAATFGYLFVKDITGLFIVQAVLGLGSAIATPTWEALYSTNADKKKAGVEWGLADGGARVVIGIAVVIGGFIVNTFGFRPLFFIMGCVQIVATIVQARILIKKK